MYSGLILAIVIFIPYPIMIKYMLAGKNPYRTVLEGTLSAVIGVAMVFLYSYAFTEMSISARMGAILNNINAKDMLALYETMGIKQLDPERLQQAADAMKEIMIQSLPGTIILWACVLSYINYLLISWILKKSGKSIPMLPPFRNFTLPKNSLAGSVIIFLLSYLAGSLGIIDSSLLMLNIEMIFRFVFSVQGLAVLFFFGKTRGIPTIVAVIAAAIFVLTGFGQMALFILGLTEVAFGIRKRILKKI